MSTDLLEDTEPAFSRGAPSMTVWKQQNKILWVGYRDGRCVGTIERGSRFIYLDAESTPRCSHRSLVEAESAHSEPGESCPTPFDAGRWTGRIPLVASALAAITMTVLFVFTLTAVL